MHAWLSLVQCTSTCKFFVQTCSFYIKSCMYLQLIVASLQELLFCFLATKINFDKQISSQEVVSGGGAMDPGGNRLQNSNCGYIR